MTETTTLRNTNLIRSKADLAARVTAWRNEGLLVGLVPTMGALHQGHLALVRAAQAKAQRVVTSVFVNPTQFGKNDDFGRYPRQEQADLDLLREVGCDVMYAPDVEEIYPPGFDTQVSVGALTQGLDGPFRPGHFTGVATVVTKLLLQVAPHIACFGEKDYQQLQVIRRMVQDLNLPVEIYGIPTVREADGLALSSRNAYLSPQERETAALIPYTLFGLQKRMEAGGDINALLAEGIKTLTAAGYGPIDYLELCDAETLAPVRTLKRPARLLVAAKLGKTRLIDNIPVPGP